MRRVPIALLCLAALAVAPAAARDWKRIRVATDGAYPPFSRLEADGRPGGFDVDVARALCNRLAADCEVVAPGWDELVPSLLAKKVDLVVASQPITEEARRRVEFTAAYHRIAPRFVARDGATPVDPRPEAVKGRRIGVRAGTAHAAHLEATYAPAGARILAYPHAWTAGRSTAVTISPSAAPCRRTGGRSTPRPSPTASRCSWSRVSGSGCGSSTSR
jgi:ABC-type amino acid transport substrate-binding protein